MIEYIKQDFGKRGSRMNPNYEPHHCFTICKCEICGEYYEADRLHICKTQNSYPDIEESAEEGRDMIPWIYADLDTIIDCYSEPPKEEEK